VTVRAAANLWGPGVKIDPQTVMGGSFGPSFVFEKARFGGPFLL